MYHPSPRWLQPDSYADPQKTSLILNKDDICCGWPTTVAVLTKDQYGDVVHVPNMKVRVLNCSVLFLLHVIESLHRHMIVCSDRLDPKHTLMFAIHYLFRLLANLPFRLATKSLKFALTWDIFNSGHKLSSCRPLSR